MESMQVIISLAGPALHSMSQMTPSKQTADKSSNQEMSLGFGLVIWSKSGSGISASSHRQSASPEETRLPCAKTRTTNRP